MLILLGDKKIPLLHSVKEKKKSRAAKSSDHVLSRVRGRELELFFINGLWALESLGSLASL